jgi:hypothetical protein
VDDEPTDFMPELASYMESNVSCKIIVFDLSRRFLKVGLISRKLQILFYLMSITLIVRMLPLFWKDGSQ